MVATLKVNSIQRNNADSDMITLHDDGVTHHTPINFTHTPTIAGVGMFSGTFSGQVLQMAGAQDANIGGHLQVTGTSFIDLALTCKIKPRSATSILLIQPFTSMAYGANNAVEGELLYRVDPTGGTSFGSYANIITATKSGYSATENSTTGQNTFDGSLTLSPFYGYWYNNSGWSTWVIPYWWDHGQAAGSNIEFKLRYRNTSAAVTNYWAHQGMHYGWIITEVGELP